MRNLYSLTKGQATIGGLFRVRHDRAGKLPRNESTPMRHVSHALVFAAALLISAVPATQSVALLGSSLKACEAAIKRSCGAVKPGGGRVQACIERHFHTLSGPCGDKLAHAAEIERACEPDVHQLCARVTRSAEVLACIRPKLNQVGRPCERALAKIATPLAFLLH